MKNGTLNLKLGTHFWDNIRKLNSSVLFNNNLKWLQFQIIRNSLQTNYIVSHFVRHVSPMCKFCSKSEEKISHLYWLCEHVSSFLVEVFQYVSSTGLNFAPSKTDFIFGCPKDPFDHPNNYLSLLIKKFIWQTKFKSASLTILGLKIYLRVCLAELKSIYELKNKANLFHEWINLYSDLCPEVQDACNPLQTQASAVLHMLVPPATPLQARPSDPPS